MNTKTLKFLIVAMSLAAGLGGSSTAMATPTGLQGLGAAGNAGDTWTFVCPAGTVQSRVRVFDINPINNPAALLQVVFGEDGNPTLQVTDPTEGGAPSAWATNFVDGPGLYAMTVKKTAGGNDTYIAEAQCVLAGGLIFNPALTLRINQ